MSNGTFTRKVNGQAVILNANARMPQRAPIGTGTGPSGNSGYTKPVTKVVKNPLARNPSAR
jgi:hypothetical protein